MTDLEGSTRLWEAQPGLMHEVMERHFALIEAAVGRHRGLVVRAKGEGDSVFAVFDHADDAVRAALELQGSLAAAAWPAGIDVKVRAAIHTGGAEARDGDYYGPEVNRCARLRALGHGGQTLLSAATAELVDGSLEPQITLRRLGSHLLRDVQAPEEVFQLCHPDLPDEFPPLRGAYPALSNLHAELTSFIGREQEIAQLRQLLQAARLVTLTGTGGCGKTRLALHVAAESFADHSDGVWMVELASLSDPTLVTETVATTVGLKEMPAPGGIGGEAPRAALIDQLVEHLRARRALVVLDNCEHLLQPTAELVDRLLRGCPQLRILATSREALAIHGEQTMRVPSLAVPDTLRLPTVAALEGFDAVRLFVDRARAGEPGFALNQQNALAVAQICARLDGIPLALELAAARLGSLSVEQLSTRLRDQFGLLSRGSRTALSRHQTLRATIDWSYDLLTVEERAVLRRLSVFAGGFTLEGAEYACSGAGDGLDVVDVVARLVDKSLLLYDSAASPPRYTMLETIRRYADEKLREAGEVRAAWERHRDWYLDLAEAANGQLTGSDQKEWMERLEAEHSNLRAALEFSDADQSGEQLLRLASSLWRFWWSRGYRREGLGWLEQALTRESGSEALRALALNGAGNLESALGNFTGAQRYHEQALALRRRLGDRQRISASLNNIGVSLYYQGRFDEARPYLEEALQIDRELEDVWGVSQELINLGEMAYMQGEYEGAVRLCREALEIGRSLGDQRTIAMALLNLGQAAYCLDDQHGAHALLIEALAIEHDIGESEAAETLVALSAVCRARGDATGAEGYVTEARAIAEAAGDRVNIGRALRELAAIELGRGMLPAAEICLQQATELASAAGNRREVAMCLETSAEAASAAGDATRACRLLGAAQSLREEIKTPVPPSERGSHAEILRAAGELLGDAAREAELAAGRRLGLAEAQELTRQT